MRLLSAVVSFFLALPLSANANSMSSHFGAFDSCYVRVYSQSHLQNHPQQRVGVIRLDHFSTVFGADFGTDSAKENRPSFDKNTGLIALTLSVQLRGKDDMMSAKGECLPDGNALACALECDAGTFRLQAKSDTSISLINSSRDGLTFEGCGGGQTLENVSRASDDKIFILHRAQCDKPPQK